MQHERILILDFGSQYTQLIARRIRELNIYCEIHPFNKIPKITPDIKGVILSGSPFSVLQKESPSPDLNKIKGLPPCASAACQPCASMFSQRHFVAMFFKILNNFRL